MKKMYWRMLLIWQTILQMKQEKLRKSRYDLISEPVMDPVSDTIPLDPSLEY